MNSKYYIYDFLNDPGHKKYHISQVYGANIPYYLNISNNGLTKGHEGVDYATPDGTEIYAPFDGIIVRDTTTSKDYGTFLVVWDAVQLCAVWFCHLKDVVVNIGDTVRARQLIGHTNNTGNTTGPHLHANFVETDKNGMRQHIDDGEEGFMNIEESSLVEIRPFDAGALTDQQKIDAANNIQQPPANAGGGADVQGNYYQGIDLTNTDSVKAAVDTWKAVADGQYISHDEISGIMTALDIPDGSTQQDIASIIQKFKDEAQSLEDMRRQRDTALGQSSEASGKYNTDLSNYAALVAAGYNTVDAVKKAVDEVVHENSGLTQEIKDVKTRNVALAEQIASFEKEDVTAIDKSIDWETKAKDLWTTLVAVAEAHGTKPTLEAILREVDKLQTGYKKLFDQVRKKGVKQSIEQATTSTANDTTTSATTRKMKSSVSDYLLKLFGIKKVGVSA